MLLNLGVSKQEPILFDYTADGDVQIPPHWTGFYSGLPFAAESLNEGVVLTVWLDAEQTVPLRAHCTDASGLIDTVTLFDICLASATDHQALLEKGVPLHRMTMGIGHVVMVLEQGMTAVANTQGLDMRLAMKAGKTYQSTAAALRALLKTYCTHDEFGAVTVSPTLVRVH